MMFISFIAIPVCEELIRATRSGTGIHDFHNDFRHDRTLLLHIVLKIIPGGVTSWNRMMSNQPSHVAVNSLICLYGKPFAQCVTGCHYHAIEIVDNDIIDNN